MPKCQPAEIHPRDANLQYYVEKCIYTVIYASVQNPGLSSLLPLMCSFHVTFFSCVCLFVPGVYVIKIIIIAISIVGTAAAATNVCFT